MKNIVIAAPTTFMEQAVLFYQMADGIPHNQAYLKAKTLWTEKGEEQALVELEKARVEWQKGAAEREANQARIMADARKAIDDKIKSMAENVKPFKVKSKTAMRGAVQYLAGTSTMKNLCAGVDPSKIFFDMDDLPTSRSRLRKAPERL